MAATCCSGQPSTATATSLRNRQDSLQGFEIGYELQYDTKPVIVCTAACGSTNTNVPGKNQSKSSLPPIAPGLPVGHGSAVENDNRLTAKPRQQQNDPGRSRCASGLGNLGCVTCAECFVSTTLPDGCRQPKTGKPTLAPLQNHVSDLATATPADACVLLIKCST